MIYVIVLLLLALVVYIQTMCKKKGSVLFLIASIILALISGLRYGMGSDFFHYLFYYKNAPASIMGAIAQNHSHMNIGYRVYMSMFKVLGANSDIFIFMTSICVMSIFSYTIYKNSKYKVLSLLVFYAIYYQIYLDSALRQGIALAIFFIAFYTFLKKGQILKYVICILIGFLFHESILVTLLLPIIQLFYKNFFYNKVFNGSLCVGALGMFAIRGDRILIAVAGTLGVGIPYEASTFSAVAVLLRIISMAFIYYMYMNCDDSELTDFDRFQIYSYFIGVLIFISIANVPIFSRLTEYFSILEVIIYANLVYNVRSKLTKVMVSFLCTLIVSSICVKDIVSFTNQGKYKNSNVLEYPYVTIFNKQDIFKYRQVDSPYRPN